MTYHRTIFSYNSLFIYIFAPLSTEKTKGEM